jgi:hypothetical protein
VQADALQPAPAQQGHQGVATLVGDGDHVPAPPPGDRRRDHGERDQRRTDHNQAEVRRLGLRGEEPVQEVEGHAR